MRFRACAARRRFTASLSAFVRDRKYVSVIASALKVPHRRTSSQ
jgi:hypothetical protein